MAEQGAGSGPIDMAGFPKDAFYFYQSQWTARPVLHLFPHWNWPRREGQTIPVIAYTNCQAVELFLNGRSLREAARVPAAGERQAVEPVRAPGGESDDDGPAPELGRAVRAGRVARGEA